MQLANRVLRTIAPDDGAEGDTVKGFHELVKHEKWNCGLSTSATKEKYVMMRRGRVWVNLVRMFVLFIFKVQSTFYGFLHGNRSKIMPCSYVLRVSIVIL